MNQTMMDQTMVTPQNRFGNAAGGGQMNQTMMDQTMLSPQS